MNRYPACPGECLLCGAAVLWARSSKGTPELLDPEPCEHGWILEEEGFTHVFDGHDGAVDHLRGQGWTDDQIELHTHHYCGEAPCRPLSGSR